MKLSIQPLLPIGNYLNKRYGIEMDFPDDSSIPDNFKYLNDAITAIHMSEYPQCYKDGKPLFSNYRGEEERVTTKEPEPKDKIQAFKETLDMCKTVVMLERFKPQVDRIKDDGLTQFYEQKLKSLQ